MVSSLKVFSETMLVVMGIGISGGREGVVVLVCCVCVFWGRVIGNEGVCQLVVVVIAAQQQ